MFQMWVVAARASLVKGKRVVPSPGVAVYWCRARRFLFRFSVISFIFMVFISAAAI
jgi:hypothetical protein